MKRTWLYLIGGLMLLTWLGGSTMSWSLIVDKIAQAIAYAEGFFVTGSRPARNHNPGNLTLDLIGKSIGADGPFVVYASDEDGWDNLKRQVQLMFSGSDIYNPQMTLREIASHYTKTEQESWAENVAAILGVSVDTKLGHIS